jgi:DNA-binding transcriptional LysR family regulator
MASLNDLWDTTRMRLLIELERHESLSAAARVIGIGQPAASEHLRLLEIAAGQRLAERKGRGLKLTGLGRLLSSHAAQALACLENAQAEIDAQEGLLAGTLRIAASSVPGGSVVPPALAAFSSEFPGVSIDFQISSTQQVLDWLLSGRVHVAVICVEPGDPRIATEPVLDDEIVGVAMPGLIPAMDGVVEPAALGSLTLLLQESGSNTRRFAVEELPRYGTKWTTVWQLGSAEAVKQCARAGLGVAFLSKHTLVGELERGELATFRLAGVASLVGYISVARPAARALRTPVRADASQNQRRAGFAWPDPHDRPRAPRVSRPVGTANGIDRRAQGLRWIPSRRSGWQRGQRPASAPSSLCRRRVRLSQSPRPHPGRPGPGPTGRRQLRGREPSRQHGGWVADTGGVGCHECGQDGWSPPGCGRADDGGRQSAPLKVRQRPVWRQAGVEFASAAAPG